MSAEWAQVVLAVGIPTVSVLVGILINNNRVADLRSEMIRGFDSMNRRLDDTRDVLRAEMLRMEGVIDARLRHLEEERR